MQDETPQQVATAQGGNVETITGDATTAETAEERCIGGAVMDAAVIIAPTLPVVAAWGLKKLDEHNEQKQQQPEIILPPGTEG
jgi:hypothetical protein